MKIGAWIKENDIYGTLTCSECHCHITSGHMEIKCPVCGAQMIFFSKKKKSREDVANALDVLTNEWYVYLPVEVVKAMEDALAFIKAQPDIVFCKDCNYKYQCPRTDTKFGFCQRAEKENDQ